MERLENFYKVINAGYLCISAVIILLGASLISLALYLPTDPDFGMLTNYISDMAAGPIEVKLIMLIQDVIGGIFLILIFLYIGIDLQQKNEKPIIIKTVVILGMMTAFWFMMLGIFPYDPAIPLSYQTHEVVAICGSFTLLATFWLYGIIQYRNSDFSKILPISSILTGLLFGIFIVGFIIVEYTIVPEQAFFYAIEWLAFFCLFFWLIAHGIYFIKQK